jgi:hypothetical protein
MTSHNIYPRLLNFRACGPESSEYCQMLGNEHQSAGWGWLGRAVRGVDVSADSPDHGLSGTCKLAKPALREVPGDPDQTQNA